MQESNILKSIMLAVSKGTTRLFRNNIGVAEYPNGHKVRYGLCEGSSDMIGWTSLTVTPDLVGRKIAVFTAIEAKAIKGKPSPEQTRFIEAVARAGGIAGIARSDAEAVTLIQTFSPPQVGENQQP